MSNISIETLKKAKIDAENWLSNYAEEYIQNDNKDKTLLFLIVQQYIFASYCIKNNKNTVNDFNIIMDYDKKWSTYISDLISYCTIVLKINIIENINKLCYYETNLIDNTLEFLLDCGLI